ncbi:MAG TPA: ATP phosphoribosyltransferase regulatory subunit [Erysipelotrichaceae bacterium]|nr:ATP phosphoribosyltransferase regulatory subunit [Erysipelotrichaceae bacterium]
MTKFQIPEGTKDLILDEALSKKQLIVNLEKLLDRWGYREVMTPTLEYFSTFLVGFDEVNEEDSYKFIDKNGRILTLRQDMTIPIARLVSTKFKDTNLPLRLRYCAQVFTVLESLAGNQNEETDLGVELVGEDTNCADLEILTIAMEALMVLDEKNFTLEIGNIDFFNEACIGMSEEDKEKLANLIDNKTLPELSEFVKKLDIDENKQKFFNQLPWLNGGLEILEEAKKYVVSDKQIQILDSIKELTNALIELGYKKYITIDLGKVPRLNYYTGIIFEGFVSGVGYGVLSGGRYDKLIAKFNRDLPSIGFSIKLDRLLTVVKPKLDYKERKIVHYPKDKMIKAITISKELRKDSIVSLNRKDSIEDIEIEVV